MTNDTNIELSRRKILAGLGTIGLASAGAGAGTMALFEDSEDAQAQVQSGTLDLRVNGANGTVTILDESGIAPGDSGSNSFYVRNAGNVGGILSATVGDVVDHENGRNDAEKEVDSTNGQGELSQHLKMSLSVEGDTIGPATLANTQGRTFGPWMLGGGVRTKITVNWHLPESAGNEVQSDRVTADLGLTLTQGNIVEATSGSGFPNLASGDFNAAFRYGDDGGSAEQEILIQNSAPSAGDVHYDWDEDEHTFTMEYDQSNDELTISIDGTEVTSQSGLPTADDGVGITVASRNADDGGVTVSDLTIDGDTVVPGTVSASGGEGKNHIEATPGISGGLTLEGTFQFTFGASPEAESPAIYFDFN
jgi:predicted ribosomally synthesized peptide with SipW-like signal peptide